MNFIKKSIYIFILVLFFFITLIKITEPFIQKQLHSIFKDKNISKKINKELINSTKDFTKEERLFYKEIIKKLYIKWIPLIDEAKKDALNEIKSKK